MSRTRSNILWAILLLSAIDGMLTGLMGEGVPGSAALEVVLTVIELAFIFAWIQLDSMKRQFHRSALLNIGIIGVAIVFVPVYLYRSRKPAERLSALAGLVVFSALSIGIEVGAEMLVKYWAG